MTHFFEKRDRWGNGYALWVLVAMVFVIPPAVWSLKQIRLKNDVENWLPADDPSYVALDWYRHLFPVEDRILVSWDDSSLDDPRVERFAKKLSGTVGQDGIHRNGLKYVRAVKTPQEVLLKITKYDVDPEEAIRRLEGVLISPGKLQVRLTEAGKQRRQRTIDSLVELARSELDLEITVSGPFEISMGTDDETDLDEDAAEFSDVEISEDEERLAEVIAELQREHDLQIVWPAMHADKQQLARFQKLVLGLTSDRGKKRPLVEECFLAPGAPVALTVDLTEAGMADRSEAFQAIREAAAEVGIDVNSLRMGGRPIAGNALNEGVKRAAWNPAASGSEIHLRSVILLSGLVSVGLAFVMLRSIRLAALVILSAFFTMLVAVAIVPATGGSMNMVLVVMPTLLLVLTVSAAIHVANYWKHAAHKDMRTAVVEAVKMARTPCALASVTTAIGLASLLTSSLTPVRDFGLYSAVGSLISLVVVLFCLPALLQYWPGRQPAKSEVDRTAWRWLGNFLSRFSTPVSVTCLVVFAVCTYGLKDFRTETKVIRYFPDDSRVVQDYNFLEQNLSGIVPIETIIRFDEEAQRELNFFQRMELVRRVQNKLREHPGISGSISLADFQKVHRPPKSKSGLAAMRYSKAAHETERKVKEPGTDSSRFLAVAKESADLYKQGDQRLCKTGDELWRITSQVAIMTDLDFGVLTNDLDNIARSETKFYPGAGHIVTGMVPIFLRTQQAVLESLIRSFCLAFGVIAVVMMILLKNPLAGLTAMLPNLFPVGVVFGLVSWNGLRVDIGTMITASVALGMAVDGTLHLLTWFKAGIVEGKSRSEAVSQALAHCGPAMWQTSAAVGLGLSMLYFADLLLIARFGWLMAALIGMALLADIVFLPALLAGPLGYLIQKTIACPDPTSTDDLPTDSDPPKPHLQTVATNLGRILRID